MSLANLTRCSFFLLGLVLALPASAHPDASHSLGALSGFMHPFTGLDHLLAMLAVGMLASHQQAKARWLPLFAFSMMMLIGAMIASFGIELASAEIVIALSVAALGLLLALSLKLSARLSVVVFAAFATFHGYAHTIELPSDASMFHYGAGFLIASVLIQIIGLNLGKHWQSKSNAVMPRFAGGAIAALGLFFLVSHA
jgi:urease accessory protein